MAYVATRPNGSFEIRESRATPRGPRSRTLATFRVLDDAALARATARAEAPLDLASVRRAARRAGAPVVSGSPADRAARELARALARGEQPRPGISALVARTLPPTQIDDDIMDAVLDVAPWIGASAAERGDALRDLLLLADRLPSRRRNGLTFPRLIPST